eukprot:scaffold12990_cov99-Isochrysis_galbana.AAC.4
MAYFEDEEGSQCQCGAWHSGIGKIRVRSAPQGPQECARACATVRLPVSQGWWPLGPRLGCRIYVASQYGVRRVVCTPVFRIFKCAVDLDTARPTARNRRPGRHAARRKKDGKRPEFE